MDPTNALNARAAQSLGPDSFSSPAGEPPRSPGVHPVPDTPHLAPEATPPTPAAPTHAAPTHSLVPSRGEQCPSCAAHVAPDQRYCLACGARCGEPRLPFMSAVTFMDAMKTPAGGASSAPPQHPQRRISSNTALFATIGVLLLAMGVGVLIGRSGNHTVASTPVAPQIIKVGGGGEETKTASTESGRSSTAGSSKKVTKKALKKEANTQAGAEEVLKPVNGVKLPPAKVKIGGKCDSGTAGCENGEFTGNYFGPE
jgi:hypothetical protein